MNFIKKIGTLSVLLTGSLFAQIPVTPPGGNSGGATLPFPGVVYADSATGGHVATESNMLPIVPGAPIGQYSGGTTYKLGDFVWDASGNYYQSLASSNTGNALPVLPSPATSFWRNVAPSAGVIAGGTCTNQFVSSLSTAGVPTCSSITAGELPAVTNLAGGALGSAPYQSAANTTAFIASPTTTDTYFYGWQPTGSIIAPQAYSLSAYLGSASGVDVQFHAITAFANVNFGGGSNIQAFDSGNSTALVLSTFDGKSGVYSGNTSTPLITLNQLNQAITTLATATTIAPLSTFVNLTGTTAIATITLPTGVGSTLGTCFTFFPASTVATTTAGNVFAVYSLIGGKAYQSCYNGTKFYFIGSGI